MVVRVSGIIRLLIFATVSAFAQSTFGAFVGTVRDPSGAVIGSAKVTAINKGTDARRTTLTESGGSYDLVNLEPGAYQLEVEAPGFQRGVFPNLELQSRQTVR